MTLFDYDIDQCLHVLRSGGTILYPTDTIWGLGCDATNPAAVKKIFDLKQRPDEKALIVLVANVKQVTKYVHDAGEEIFNFLRSVKKPTTVIYNSAHSLADNVIGNDGTIAIRICKDPFCKKLIDELDKPIVSTSANISGSPSPTNFTAIVETVKTSVDYVVSYRQDDEGTAQPSSLVRWQNGEIITVRP